MGAAEGDSGDRVHYVDINLGEILSTLLLTLPLRCKRVIRGYYLLDTPY